MRVLSYLLLLCIIFGMHSCREAPARGNSRKEYREKKIISEKTKDRQINNNRQVYSGSAIEIPAYKGSDNCILLKRKRYTTLYNIKYKIPEWVAWQLKQEHSDGPVPRSNDYREDLEVPSPRATNEDYKNASWTRGHMCPAGDNKWDERAMSETFLLSNMCPQTASLNTGFWNRLEQSCRIWAKKYGDLYIVCGPVFLNTEHETIGANKVVVPEAFFKVILCLQGTPKAIGFVIRNNDGKKKRDQFVNTVDDVERITGFDFYPALPDSIENRVEAYANLEDWR